MNDIAKTGAFVGVAAVLTVLATMVGPKPKSLELFHDEGQLFFPDFKDAAAATELEVIEFREAAGAAYPFVVKRDDKGRWTIPSHSNYLADAKDRMGKAAALLIGLEKSAVQGDEKGRHVDYGVVDPLDPSADPKGRGTRMKLKDSAGNVLADLVIGKAVDGKPDWHYVRLPDKKRVYRTKLGGEVSTKFADWIETDLLKATAWDIDKVTFDNYSVDEQKGSVEPGEKYVVHKDETGKWTFDGLDASKEEANADKLREIGDTLGKVKIVGVRPKPDGLTARLEKANGFDFQVLAQSLAAKGFFLGRGGQMFSNEGDLLFETKKGVRYTLRFGELVLGDGDEVSAGAEPKPTAPGKPADAPKQDKPANNRYLMVTAEFDPALLKKPTGEHLSKEQLDKRAEARREIEAIQRAVEAFRGKHENQLPDSLARLTEKPAEGDAPLAELKKDPWGNDYQLDVQGTTYAVISRAEGGAADGDGAAIDIRSDRLPLEDELARQATEWTEYERKVADGQKEAESLTKRFGPWYYVIDQELFAKLKPKRADLVKPKSEAPAETPAGPGGATEPGK
ncbi:MAG: DUF4340 domain-containing protein [Planctomycetes bacterium]|nr:DUF4340 domain-containing protein [Planctomycetota bacterium]MCC7396951.1 DUF4340 domain-containing protein [Planctomycetota bacterium]